jgi:D-3-phosphoglycerate dehydrogenase
VLRRLSAFGTPRVLANDLKPVPNVVEDLKLEWVDKDTIFREADLISVHVPLTKLTKNMIRYEHLKAMKSDAIVINASRGGIINEADLARTLNEGHLSGAAVDAFEQEPYNGPLCEIENCLLTAHMGSMSVDCRNRMEIEATEEAVRFVKGEPLMSPVPPEEYEVQQQGL